MRGRDRGGIGDYLVGTHLGIEMADETSHYVAGWAPDLDTVTAVGQWVMKTAAEIMDAVEITDGTDEEVAA